MNDDFRVKRITKYEQIMCDVEQMIENYSEDRTHILQEKVKELEAYYSSDEWKQDFEYDEAGHLPKDMKRGVLSEDGIYNLLERYHELKGRKQMETERLILRRWEDSDAEDLFKYASDSDVGPIAGWPPHQSIDESRDVIKNVLNGAEVYAVCLKEDEKAIGAIELKLNGHTDMTDRDDECELGYWLGKPFWGQGIMPEAVKEMLRHAFEDCGMQKVWIGYYEGNTKSKRVQEKCGFKYQWRSENVDVPLMHEKRTGHVSLMTKEDWEAMQ